MHRTRRTRVRAFVPAVIVACAVAAAAVWHASVARAAVPTDDLIAAQVARWTAVLTNETRTDDLWGQVKASAQPELERSAQALRDGRRWLALERLAAVWANMDGACRVGRYPAAARADLAALEREWTRAKPEFDRIRAAAADGSLGSQESAVVRALAEAALSHSRAFYDASIEYGRNTTPEFGYFYLESARAQLEFVELCRSLVLAGRSAEAKALAAPADTGEVRALPDLAFTDLDGRTVSSADLVGRVVIVDFWATWCPPCRGALAWLGEMKQRYGNRFVVLALAIESDEAEARKVAGALKLPFRFGIRTPAMLRAFGDVSAVPTLLVFDQHGKAAGAFYGSTPALHQGVAATLEALMPPAAIPHTPSLGERGSHR